MFGGTFDPVHFGHLRSAVEVRHILDLDTIKLTFLRTPPHRDLPGSTPQQRLDMVRLATRDVPCLEVDDREIRREGKSFMIDTLRSIRSEIGADIPLILVIGFDAFTLLDSWRDWRSLLDLAHLAVIGRPGHAASETNESAEWVSFRKPVDEFVGLFSEKGLSRCRCACTATGGLMCRALPGSTFLNRYAGNHRAGRVARLPYAQRGRSLYPRTRVVWSDLNVMQQETRYSMQSADLKQVVMGALEDVKAQEITWMDVTAQTDVTDYMVVASGTSNTHVNAVVDRGC
ncbi:MAG: RsfS/YbeB/iojap family protein [Gammaproteobacteria bacterium]|nr:RsfS/YbeB/iojap family protein [Gammaproteobacteria bacterium]